MGWKWVAEVAKIKKREREKKRGRERERYVCYTIIWRKGSCKKIHNLVLTCDLFFSRKINSFARSRVVCLLYTLCKKKRRVTRSTKKYNVPYFVRYYVYNSSDFSLSYQVVSIYNKFDAFTQIVSYLFAEIEGGIEDPRICRQLVPKFIR